MAEEDLIFRLEGVDGRPASRAGDSDTDSDDDEEGYFICSITDDPGAHQNVNFKVNNCHSNLAKSERYGSSGSPAGSFHFKEAWKHAIEKAKHMPDPGLSSTWKTLPRNVPHATGTTLLPASGWRMKS